MFFFSTKSGMFCFVKATFLVLTSFPFLFLCSGKLKEKNHKQCMQLVMATAHTDLILRHKQILRHRLKKYNEANKSMHRFGQKNIDLLFYLNYIRFVKTLADKAGKIASIEGSSEVMTQHWEEAGKVTLDTFEKEDRLD